MKREVAYLAITNAFLVFFILFYTFDLLTLCIDDTIHDTLTASDLNSSVPREDELIPRIIHQTYKTEDIPKHWIEGQHRCQELHSDYQYIMWTDQMALDFITEHYSWFLPTFVGYKRPIQRADAIRYFILYHYGGIYIDLDDKCERPLDNLLKLPAFVRKTSPLGISNDVMGSMPGHPFFWKAIHNLNHYNKNWYVPYLTIMSSTGPLFISIVWKHYRRWKIFTKNYVPVKIIQPQDYKGSSSSFFSIVKGSSWHTDDAKWMKSLENHILSCVVAGFIFAFFILYGEYIFYCWLCYKKPITLTNSDSGSKNSWSSKLLWVWNRIKFRSSSYTTTYPTTPTTSPKRSRKDSNTVFDIEKRTVNV